MLRNLELCFPSLSPAERSDLGRRHFESFGASLAEIAIAWFATAERARPPIRVEGLANLEAALAKGRGAILYSGHFTTLELTTQHINSLTPSFAFMFRRRSNPLLDALQARGRERTARASVSNGDVRGMLRMLSCNGAIWYAPDQVYAGRGAVRLPFFGEPAMTNTATARLARLSGAAIVPLFFCRLPRGEGYLLRFEPSLTDVPTGDATADTERLVRVLERFVRKCPEQYFWTHRKFKSRGEDLPDAYRPPSAPLKWRERLAVPGLIGAVALFIATLQSRPLWSIVWRATRLEEQRLSILGSIFAVLFGSMALLLALAAGRRALKIVAATLLVTGAGVSYVMAQYDLVIDEAMILAGIRSAAPEISPHFGAAFVWHVVLLGLLPATLVALVPLRPQSALASLLGRAGMAAIGVAALLATLYVA